MSENRGRLLRFSAPIRTRALLSTVVGVHDFLTWFAAGNAASHPQRMGQLNGFVRTQPIPPAVDAKQFADGIAELVCVPLWVIRADFVGIADSTPCTSGSRSEEH